MPGLASRSVDFDTVSALAWPELERSCVFAGDAADI